MTWEEAKLQCPDGIVPACHNAAQSVTISGAADMISSFVEKVKETGGFVSEVDSNDIPFHSLHLEKAGKAYLAALRKVFICIQLNISKAHERMFSLHYLYFIH